MSAIFVSLKPC